MIGNFNLCSKTGRTARQEINKDMEDLNTIKQHTLTDKYRTLDPTTAEYTFFPSNVYGTCEHVLRQTTSHILGHKTSFNNFNKFKRT